MPDEDTQGSDRQDGPPRQAPGVDWGQPPAPGEQPVYPPPHAGYPPPHPGYPSVPPGYPPAGYAPNQGAVNPGGAYAPPLPPNQQDPWAPGPGQPAYAPYGSETARDPTTNGQPQATQFGISEPPSARSPRRRRNLVFIAVAILVVVGLLAGGGVALFGSSSPTNPSSPLAPVSPAARTALRQAIAAAESAGSFHYVSSTTTVASSGTSSATTLGDAGKSSGVQEITTNDPTNGPASFTVLVVGTTAYFRGDVPAIEENLNLTSQVAQAHSGQWISLQPSDGSVYASVYAAVNTHDALAENISIKPQQLGSATQGGKNLDTITGALTPVVIPGQGTQNMSGTGTLEISARTHLPVRYDEHGTSKGQRTTFTMTFNSYGEQVAANAPTSSTTYASIAASGGTNPGGGAGGGGATSPTFLT